MSIKGITDTVTPAFPRIGKLRKGAERTEADLKANRPGKELDHWRFTSDNPDVEAAFIAAYGQEPREVDVYLPSAKLEANFETWQEKRTTVLQHRGDGETCVLWLTQNGTYSHKPIHCPGGCSPVGRLSVILPVLLHAGYVGHVVMETHSINDILGIQATLLKAIADRGVEDLRGIGFVLRRVQQEIGTPGAGGKRIRRKKWLVKLEPAAEWVMAQMASVQRFALGSPDEDDEVAESVEATEVAEAEIVKEKPWFEVAGNVEQILATAGKFLTLTDKEVLAIIGEKGWAQFATGREAYKFVKAHAGEDNSLEPRSPEEVRQSVLKAAAEGLEVTVSGGLRGLVCGALEGLFPDDDKMIKTKKRYELLQFFFDVDSAKKLTQGQAQALLKWSWDREAKAPRPEAVQEAGKIIEMRAVEKGQQTLPLEGEGEDIPMDEEEIPY